MTLTIEAENAAATDINYTVLRLSVAAKVRGKTHVVGYGRKESKIRCWFGLKIKSQRRIWGQAVLCVQYFPINISLSNHNE